MERKQKRRLCRILLAAALFAAVLAADRLGVLPAVFTNRWFAMALYLAPYLLCGTPVLRKAALGVKNRQPFDECFLMTVATVGAFATAENAEAVAVMLFYQVGEWFQDYAVGRSRGSVKALMEIVPSFARVERNGEVETVDPDEVAVGDVLVIRPGERIPVDGTVLSGESWLDTSALTGESVPRRAGEGTGVVSGCINGEGLLRVRCDKVFEDSAVSRILALVEEAAEKKSATEQFITRFARHYTPAVVFSALALALVPPIFGGAWGTWIYRACAFLVISCPCALVISVPLAFFGGIGAASRCGVLVKGSNYLELLAGLDTVVSDKTGTLTKGEFKVSAILCAKDVSRMDLLTAVSAAESGSTHPIAQAILRDAAEEGIVPPAAQEVQNHAGSGVSALVSGETVLVGSEAFLEQAGVSCTAEVPEGVTVCHAARNGAYLGAVCISDAVKDEAPRAIRALRRQGVRRMVMLTGDRAPAALAVARTLGVDEVYARLLPGDKVAKVEELLAALPAGGRLAFIGDGINDAPVLRRADVGIAMGSLGSDAAIEAADVVIMDDDLRRLPRVMEIARRTVTVSRQNIVFALAVKAAVLIISAAGLATMWTAVFADVGVAVLCILNAMRLLSAHRTVDKRDPERL